MVRFAAMMIVASVGVSLVLGGAVAVAALSNLSYAYQSTSEIAPGSLVSLDSGRQHYVLPANNQNGQQLLGVAVAPDNSLLTADAASGNVQVGLSGVVDVLVSTLNGSIARGDHIGVSAINGVGMKAAAGTRVIGASQATFSASSPGATTRRISVANGRSETVAVGYVPVTIAISSEPDSGVSGALAGARQFVASIVGHPVSTLPVVVSAIVAVVALVAVIALIYGTVRGSLVSVGRNPLAKQAIFESLAQVMAMAALIVALAVITIYLTLR